MWPLKKTFGNNIKCLYNICPGCEMASWTLLKPIAEEGENSKSKLVYMQLDYYKTINIYKTPAKDPNIWIKQIQTV